MPGDWNGARIRALRAKLGLTQKDLAERIEVHSVTISRWESDLNEPHGLAIKQLEQREAMPAAKADK
jgi:transcriptional regulator with XRE-family HTH domain